MIILIAAVFITSILFIHNKNLDDQEIQWLRKENKTYAELLAQYEKDQ